MYYVCLVFFTIPTTIVVTSIKWTGPFGGFKKVREKYILQIKSKYYVLYVWIQIKVEKTYVSIAEYASTQY